ncbi:MAG: sugar transferase [Clostridia bacterium]|nr:sugar transferase [Clostridia bacterium]
MYKKYIKRIVDIFISLIVLIALSPVYFGIAVLIKILDKDSTIYKQIRTGKNGTQFIIFKFKTMKDGTVTKLGKWLRITSLDEIPQFYNVLKGDMSIVGPRPWIPEYYNNFNEQQKKRTKVRPGLVGLAQVNGRNKINIFEKINYDIEYVNNVCFLLDIKIALKSFFVVAKKDYIGGDNYYIKKEIELLKKQNNY